MERLDFEKPIIELEEQLNKAIQLGIDTDADVKKTVNDLEKQLKTLRKTIYADLTAWQRVQISRHPNRPYTLDYIEALTKGDFMELHANVYYTAEQLSLPRAGHDSIFALLANSPRLSDQSKFADMFPSNFL